MDGCPSHLLLLLLLNLFIFLLPVSRVAADIGFPANAASNAPDVTFWGGASTSSVNSAYDALQAWKSAITSDPNNIMSSWIGDNVCSYIGVYCATPVGGESRSPIVVGIDLNRANLQGTLVPELSLLTDLAILHLNSNGFSGAVPDSFSGMVSLSELDLSNNLFGGPFPLVTLSMPNLIYLDIRFNSFSGPIPDALFGNKLDAIFLNNNNFEGDLPQNIGNSQASVINLANNNLTGSLPVMFGVANSMLKEILLLNNQLTGCIPEQFGLFSDVEVLDVSFNSLSGEVPDAISCLNQLEVLNLEHNLLSGQLPDVICSLKRLLNFTVAFNFFSNFSQQCEMEFVRNSGFDVSDNCIPGVDLQRPRPDCFGFPGSGLSCLRIPMMQPLVCANPRWSP